MEIILDKHDNKITFRKDQEALTFEYGISEANILEMKINTLSELRLIKFLIRQFNII